MGVLTWVFDPKIVSREVKTPRQLVSVQATIFDPDGHLAPFNLPGRKWLQIAKTGQMGWDSPLAPDVKKGFDKWKASIPLLANLKVDRWLNGGIEEKDVLSEELHLFSGAATGG